MTAQPAPHLTPAEYLDLERAGEERREYLAGKIYATAGGSKRHNRIAGSAYAALYAQLRQRDGVVYPSDMRVKSARTGLYTYPDITIVCGDEEFEDDNLLSPTV
ncbi:MAG: Uma2 family endonuclease [Oscillochloridaceae bacterium]|nr:Uma2 family endonuclease [Chloroflexaceae bacterium]MDW8391986.1 Uma2 family endonuclease [Oscillochloridaceae bacterium]